MLEAFVEHHRDIRSELRLDIYRGLRCQQMLAAVEMRAERRTLFVHLATRRETEDLIAAAVGEDGLVPSDEGVETTERADAFGARPQIEMIGIGEDDLCAEIVEIAMCYGFHGALSADSHERGRVHDAVRRRQHTTPRGAVRVRDFELEHRHQYVVSGFPPSPWLWRVSPKLACFARATADSPDYISTREETPRGHHLRRPIG